jgi:hypothetical protein
VGNQVQCLVHQGMHFISCVAFVSCLPFGFEHFIAAFSWILTMVCVYLCQLSIGPGVPYDHPDTLFKAPVEYVDKTPMLLAPPPICISNTSLMVEGNYQSEIDLQKAINLSTALVLYSQPPNALSTGMISCFFLSFFLSFLFLILILVVKCRGDTVSLHKCTVLFLHLVTNQFGTN